MESNLHRLNGKYFSSLDRIRSQLQSIEAVAKAAEQRIEAVNSIIDEVEKSGLLHHAVLLGDLILKRSYPPAADGHDSGQLVQPALLIPGGLGALHWDSEKFFELSRQLQGLEAEASRCFVPASQCKPAVCALIALELDDLVELLMDQVSRCGV